ncbi:pirin family protein [Shewanella sedimentimangrovi]|uniref:Pirin family protein n=1 Tax=Shewanella sedimentimangrovi TaxID=2814293 RepID=A0ABX7QXB0_9GAMM|nr:pirin family protein [Shewanella sedimentimangrovi]QSX36152.1 pirin family protein [Shewanella sedimentimangrovi]
MIQVRKASERGHGFFGWLDSRHSFSFGNYYDPEHMGFSALRVINDDWVAPGAGFDTHGHRDMEILTCVLKGQINHKDSQGNIKALPEGEFQLMSAGSGIFHSEFNASKEEELRFLQIWIQPSVKGGTPGYQQQNIVQTAALTPVVTPDGRSGTMSIKQDATVYQLSLATGDELRWPLTAERHYYLHLISGELQLGDVTLLPGDGAKISHEQQLIASASAPVSGLLFDLP